jgi:hypothetical protein
MSPAAKMVSWLNQRAKNEMRHGQCRISNHEHCSLYFILLPSSISLSPYLPLSLFLSLSHSLKSVSFSPGDSTLEERQRRTCLILGAVARNLHKSDPERAEQLIGHIESWILKHGEKHGE